MRVEDGSFTKQSQKRQFRSSKSRRRSERFSHKTSEMRSREKAQLQKSRNPCGEGDCRRRGCRSQQWRQQLLQRTVNPDPKPLKSSSQSLTIQISEQTPQQDTTQVEEHSRTRDVCFQTSQTQTQIPQNDRQVWCASGEGDCTFR